MTGEREARMALCALEPQGAPAFVSALREFGPVDLWQGILGQGQDTSWGRRAQAVTLDDLRRRTEACGARFVIPGDEEWPATLAGLDRVSVTQQTGEPVGLWVKGEPLSRLAGGVAVVGARAATAYGENATLEIAADLAAAGRVVISGLAFGIDAAAHRGALGVRGCTAAVLAGGVDEPYPAANRRLAEAVVGSGALVSELPPGSRPTKFGFLARNRVIAALASAVVVIEAAARSGAKNTASWASALGVPLLAVPGHVTSSLSATPHRLIREGAAILCTCAADVEEVLGPLGAQEEPDGRGEVRPLDRLPQELQVLREAVRPREAVTAAQLSARTGQRMFDVLANAGELVDLGWLEETEDGFILPARKRPGA